MKPAEQSVAATGEVVHATDFAPCSLPTISTRAMLEGLARIHPLVLALDGSYRVVWTSDELTKSCGDPGACLGRPIARLLEKLGIVENDLFRARVRGSPGNFPCPASGDRTPACVAGISCFLAAPHAMMRMTESNAPSASLTHTLLPKKHKKNTKPKTNL